MKLCFFAPLALLLLGGCGGYKTSGDPSKLDEGARAADVKFEFKTLPRRSVVGETTMWDIKIVNLESKRGFKSFEDQNGQRLRLVVASHDLEEWQIAQPDYKDYGHFVMQGRVGAGPHRVFALFTPFGGEPVVQSVEFPATEIGAGATSEGVKRIPKAGPILIPDKLVAGRIEKRFDLARVELQTSTLRAGQSTNLSLVVRDANGASQTEFASVLGSPAQCVAIHEDAKTLVAPKFLATTGTKGAPFVWNTLFPREGKYKIWAQFAPRGQNLVASFVLQVQKKEKP